MSAAVMTGFALRLILLDGFPLREDEALYGAWALHAWLEDPRFLSVWPDKPPLFLWLLGGAMRMFGADAAGARVLNIAASTLTAPVVGATAGALWGRRTAVAAAWAMALNPFAVAFGPTVFTDPLLVLWGSLALLLALRRRPLWAGLWLGAAIMTKQQGLLYMPLVAGALWLGPVPQGRRTAIAALICGVLLTTVPIIVWDATRWTVAPSPWDLGVKNYGALTLLPVEQWAARGREWLPWLCELLGSPTAAVGMLGLALLGWLGGWPHRHHAPRVRQGKAEVAVRRYGAVMPALSTPQQPQPLQWRANRLNAWRWICHWSLGFVALHVIGSVAVWDRYLLPLTPIVALLVAILLEKAVAGQPRLGQAVVAAAALCVFLVPAWHAAQGQRPVGGDHGDYAGLHESLDWLAEQAAAEPIVLYHQTLGWHYRFYLYAAIRAGRYELRWFPSPVYLADRVAKTPGGRQLLVLPDWAPVRDLALHLRLRNSELVLRFRAGQMSVYELRPAPDAYCGWCVTQPPAIDNRPAAIDNW